MTSYVLLLEQTGWQNPGDMLTAKTKTAGVTPPPAVKKILVEQRGIEPLTSALRTRRSAKLSYCPTRG